MQNSFISNEPMYGVVDGYFLCHLDRNTQLDKRIADRNIPSGPLQPSFNIRPVSTKYDIMGVVDRHAPVSVPIKQIPTYSVGSTFYPGDKQAPWSGFATNISIESQLRNQVMPKQNCEASVYIPCSNSDMYKTLEYKSSNEDINPHSELQRINTLETSGKVPEGLGINIFSNHTRQQLKNC